MFRIRRRLALRSGVMALVALGLMTIAMSASAVTLKQIKERGYIRIAVSYDIPYGYVDASGHAKGAGPDVAKAVLKSMGIDQIQWVVMPFGSLIPAVKANRVDMAAEEMNTLPQRCRAVDFSIPNTTYGEGLLVKKVTRRTSIPTSSSQKTPVSRLPSCRAPMRCPCFRSWACR